MEENLELILSSINVNELIEKYRRYSNDPENRQNIIAQRLQFGGMTPNSRAALHLLFESNSLEEIAKVLNLSVFRILEILKRYNINRFRLETDIAHAKWPPIIQANKISTIKKFAEVSGMTRANASEYLKDHGVALYSESEPKIVGETFGLWLVSRKLSPSKYWCQCLGCGKESAVQKRYLLEKRSSSCQSCAAKLRMERRKSDH